jgi:hypothetical protein
MVVEIEKLSDSNYLGTIKHIPTNCYLSGNVGNVFDFNYPVNKVYSQNQVFFDDIKQISDNRLRGKYISYGVYRRSLDWPVEITEPSKDNLYISVGNDTLSLDFGGTMRTLLRCRCDSTFTDNIKDSTNKS